MEIIETPATSTTLVLVKCKLCELSFLPAERLFFEKHEKEDHLEEKLETMDVNTEANEKDDCLIDEFEEEEKETEPLARVKIKEGAQSERKPTVQAAQVNRDFFTHSKAIWKESVAGSPKSTQRRCSDVWI